MWPLATRVARAPARAPPRCSPEQPHAFTPDGCRHPSNCFAPRDTPADAARHLSTYPLTFPLFNFSTFPLARAYASSLASIVILALSTRETGQPAFALLAASS